MRIISDPNPLDLLLTIPFLALGGLGLWLSGPWTIPGWFALGISIVIALFVPSVSSVYAVADLWRARADFAKIYQAGDPQTRGMMAIAFPTLRIKFDGEPSVQVDDSGVELHYFQEFMQRSDTGCICPENYSGDKTNMRRQWTTWRDWLIRRGDVVADSARGPRSWRWTNPERYHALMVYVTLRRPSELIPYRVAPEGTSGIPDDNVFEEALP